MRVLREGEEVEEGMTVDEDRETHLKALPYHFWTLSMPLPYFCETYSGVSKVLTDAEVS